MTEAKWAYGTTLKKGSQKIAELTNINGLDLDSDEIDVTHLESPGGYEEVIQTIRRTGVVTIEGNFVPGDPGQADLMADYLSGDVESYTIDFSAAGIACEWNFDAYVKKAPSTEAPVDGKIPFSAELRVTGQPSLDLDYSGTITTIAITDPVTTLVPAYSADINAYVADVASGVSEIKFTVTEAGAGTLSVDGTAVSTGVESSAFALGAAGSVTSFTVARKETGKIPRRYTVYVARASV